MLGAPTSTNEVVITAGASEAADLVLTALVNPGDEVLLPAPGYPIYPAILNKLGAVARYYHLDQNNDWQPSLLDVRTLLTSRTKTIVLINPSNPTGGITPDETTRELLKIAAQHNLLIISDEVYRDLCFERAPTSASVLAQDTGAPVITLESLSKTHMLSGWRIGWMRFTHSEQMPDLVGAIGRLASGRLCSPTPAQYAIRPAFEGGPEYISGFVQEIKHRRDLAVGHVRSIKGLSCSTPDAAFYLMIRMDNPGARSDEELALELLEHAGVLLVHGSGFGTDPSAGYFRLVYLANEELLEQSFAGIKTWMDSRS
jgi:aspartate/methionine/tyrosine aminotransferase